MRYNNGKNAEGYSILIAIFMVGFLLVLTTGVFNLVLGEMNSNRGGENYLKAYGGAEGAMELGLLNIKKEGYGIDKDVVVGDPESQSLIFDGTFNSSTDPEILYNMDVETQVYTGALGIGATDIIPLFVKKTSTMYAQKLSLQIDSGASQDLIWNIIGDGVGGSGSGSFDESTTFSYRNAIQQYIHSERVDDFLNTYNGSYLMLYNKSTSTPIEYTLNEGGTGHAFSKPIGRIDASVKVGGYRQNITTEVNNSDFLKMFKYSVYSN